MDCSRNNCIENIESDNCDYSLIFQNMVGFLRENGLTVNTNTKARGHQGFFLKNRIDISSVLSPQRKVEVLIHEFTHYAHFLLEKDLHVSHGNLSVLFPDADINKIENELWAITLWVDKNQARKRLCIQREDTLDKIKDLDKKIKSVYPDFKRSYSYKNFDKLIKKCDAKYLLKYDRVRVKNLFGGVKEYSVHSVDVDFPNFDEYIVAYIKIKSYQRLLRRISSRLNRLNSYYKRPAELFARFVEGLFIDTHKVSQIAPYTYLVFCKELANNHYGLLADFINNFF